MTPERFSELINNATFKFAKTMSAIPHSYTLIYGWDNKDDFYECVKFIKEKGYQEKFYSKTFTYYNDGEHKYWSMDDEIEKTVLINRAKL